jgi:hypothetical protein
VRSLPALDQAVREVIVLAADLSDEAMPGLVVDYDYYTGDPPCSVDRAVDRVT